MKSKKNNASSGRRLIIVVGGVLFLQMLFVMMQGDFGLLKLPEKTHGYMAHGAREITYFPRKEIYQVGDSIVLRYRFRCEETNAGDEIFLSLVVQSDSSIEVMKHELSSSASSSVIDTTHYFVGMPVARGWTVGRLSSGETVQMNVEIRVRRFPKSRLRDRPSSRKNKEMVFIELMAVMEKDTVEPDGMGAYFKKTVVIRR
ncbi:MAG: hypothetical protein JKX97_08830 [Candidatus Lindowbacteria bacterium]|nr:hypothetical protein [Candidatus Lindowbacteria bacterium]